MELFVFYLFATIAVLAALVVVLQRRAIYSAIALIVCFGSMAGLFFQLGALFIGAIQIIVYAGAIMVLFLFVVMLINPEAEAFSLNRLKALSVIALPMSAFLGLLLFWGLTQPFGPPGTSENQTLVAVGGVESIARELFRDYLLPFEVTSILILVAVIGAMVLAKPSD